MPKYWGKQIFAHGRFPEVSQKQKTERSRKKREKDQTMAIKWPSYAWRMQARMAHASCLGQFYLHISIS